MTTEDQHNVTDADTTAEEIDESSAAVPEATATVEPSEGTQVDETPAPHEAPMNSAWGHRRLVVPLVLATGAGAAARRADRRVRGPAPGAPR